MSTMNVKEAAMKQAEENGGKLAVVSKVTIDSKEDLSIAYTPGVAAVSSAIAENEELACTNLWWDQPRRYQRPSLL